MVLFFDFWFSDQLGFHYSKLIFKNLPLRQSKYLRDETFKGDINPSHFSRNIYISKYNEIFEVAFPHFQHLEPILNHIINEAILDISHLTLYPNQMEL